jgi:hypothetical protein
LHEQAAFGIAVDHRHRLRPKELEPTAKGAEITIVLAGHERGTVDIAEVLYGGRVKALVVGMAVCCADESTLNPLDGGPVVYFERYDAADGFGELAQGLIKGTRLR